MTYDVVMPQLGLTMEEGSVVSWQKRIGDRVSKGETLFTVETDKAQMEVEAADSGCLNAIRVEVGKMVPVGTVIATLGDQPGEVTGEERDLSPQVVPAAQVQETTAPEVESSAEEISDSSGGGVGASLPETTSSREFVASPRARRLAQELGIDITAVRPARGSRIVEEDVRRFQESGKGTSAPGQETD